MRYIAIFLAVLLLGGTAEAQSVNDLVQVWLSQAGKTAAPADYSTCQPAGQSDGICTWNAANLGPQPTTTQLQALVPTWQAQQTAKANAVTAQAAYAQALGQGVVVTCASGATVCTSSITGTYTVPSATGAAANVAAQTNINSVETAIAAGRGLPGGGTSFNYFDTSGQAHAFTAAQWGEFSTAMMNYSYALQSAYITAQVSGAFAAPSNVVQLQ